MPSAPRAASSRERAMTSAVLYPPAPPRTGALPLANSTVILTTRRCSSCVSVGLSPVVPQGTRKSTPASICRLIKTRRAGSSREPSRRKGVTSAVPVPVNMMLLLPFFPQLNSLRISRNSNSPFFPTTQRAARKTFAAARRVTKRDGVRGGIETDFMRAGMRTRAVGTQADRTVVAACSHLLRKFLQRPRRAVFLRGVVNFPAPGFVFPVFREERRGVRDGLQEKVHANRAIGRPDNARSAACHRFADRGNMIEPDGCADNRVNAQCSQTADIFRSSIR